MFQKTISAYFLSVDIPDQVELNSKFCLTAPRACGGMLCVSQSRTTSDEKSWIAQHVKCHMMTFAMNCCCVNKTDKTNSKTSTGYSFKL